MTDLTLGAYDNRAPATLPLDAQTTALALVGRRGSGKTTAAMVIAEEMIDHGLAVIVLDVLGVCWGLRSSADGAGAGLPVTILGGAHGDLPLEPTAGALVAALVVEHPGAYIIDLSTFESKADEDRFAADFAHRLYRLKAVDRSPLHLIVDEADNFAPQMPMPGQQRMLGAFNDIVRRGRVRGLGVSLITQRPAVLNKNVLSQIECLIAMQTTAPQDREALKAWAQGHGEKAQVDAFLASLASLSTGEAWLWSPSWLQMFQRLTVRRRRTFDSSATPKAGEARIEPRVLAPVDLEALRVRMAETIERAAAMDPKKLQAEVARLRGELAAKAAYVAPRSVEPAPCDHPAEIARLKVDLDSSRFEADVARQERDELVEYKTWWMRQMETVAELVGVILEDAKSEEEDDARTSTTRHGDDAAPQGARSRSREPEQRAQPEPSSPRGPEPDRQNDGSVGRGDRALSTQPGPGEMGRSEGRARTARSGRDTEDMKDEEVRELVRAEVARAVAALPGGRTVYVPAAEVIRLDYQQRAIQDLFGKVNAIEGGAREAIRFMLGQDGFISVGRLTDALGGSNVHWGKLVKALKDNGYVSQGGISGGGSGYKPRLREWVADELAPHAPTGQEVEDVYQAVLGRVAGEVVVG